MASTFYQIGSIILMISVLWAVLYIVYVSWKNGVPPMPSSASVRQIVTIEVSRLLEPERGLIVEAGSGWGTLAFEVMKDNKTWQLIGVENSFIPLWISRISARLKRRKNVSFIRGDIYEYPYGNVDVILCYLYPGAMERLSKLFCEQLRPKTIIVSICFALPNWQPIRVITCRDLYRTKVYVYRSPM